MGKQITYYMDSRDEAAFIAYVRTTGDVAIVPGTSRGELTEEFQTFRDAEGRALGQNLYLWNRSISPRPVVKHIPQQGYYCLYALQSEVIDVWRCKVTAEGLSMGRLWMEPKILTSDKQMQAKGSEYIAWYSALCRWIKKQGVAVVDGAYVLPGANELVQGGQKLTGHVP